MDSNTSNAITRTSWTRFALCFSLFAGSVVSGCDASARKSEEARPQTALRPYVLLDVMHQFQRYADKLYFSGKAGNWELADWYLWKLESAALLVVEHRVEPYRTDSYDAQPLMKALLVPAIHAMGPALEKKSEAEFLDNYQRLVQTCNGCHVATRHAFVRIVVPTTPIYTNQNYAP